MNDADARDFLPTAAMATLQRRAKLLRALRRYFDDHGYWEVETPILSQDVIVDAHLEPFEVEDADGTTRYLQTSPEFGMKRLLAAGAEAIYQITRAFRREECGLLHNPEFTMLEWYRTGDTHREQMEFTEGLIRYVFAGLRGDATDGFGEKPFARLTYDEAFERTLGTRVLALSGADLRALAESRGIRYPATLTDDDRDEWLNLLLADCVEPLLRSARPTFLYDYPASQAALAVIRDDHPPVAERFELYIAGIEICNGYHELTDPAELQRRTSAQSQIRARSDRRPLPADSRLLQAMQHGLPPSSGVALGVDRLAMVILGEHSLPDVVAFPWERA